MSFFVPQGPIIPNSGNFRDLLVNRLKATTGGGGGTPSGNNTSVQYNNDGTFGGDDNLTWDSTTQTLTVSDSTIGQTNLGFFGKSIEKQTLLDYTNNSIIEVLVKYGFLDNYYQQGTKLIGTGAIGNAKQGYGVAINANNDTIASGGPDDDGATGAVWIFTRTAGVWTQQGSKLVGTGSVGTPNQGIMLSLSDDGNTLAVGGVGDDINIGATWVFTRTAGVWTQQGLKLVGSGAVNSNQGYALALSGDGNTLAVGGFNDDGGRGATWVFTRTAGVWTQQGTKLIGTGAIGNVNQGFGITISDDGNTLASGGTLDNGSVGSIWVFTRTAGVWTQQGSKLMVNDNTGNSNVGFGVSLSADGNTLAVGGLGDDGGIGATWVFTRTAGVWTQQGSKLVGTGAIGNAGQGTSVSLSKDGNQFITSGFNDDGGIGATWIFTRSAGVWTQFGPKMVGSGNVGLSCQGCDTGSASLSANKITFVVGGPNDDTNIGAAWVFSKE